MVSVGAMVGQLPEMVLFCCMIGTPAFFLLMASVIPGQKIDCEASVVMAVTPWCPPCRVSKVSYLNSAGITTLPLYARILSHVLRCCFCG